MTGTASFPGGQRERVRRLKDARRLSEGDTPEPSRIVPGASPRYRAKAAYKARDRRALEIRSDISSFMTFSEGGLGETAL